MPRVCLFPKRGENGEEMCGMESNPGREFCVDEDGAGGEGVRHYTNF
jgi:hypothetical protein